MGISGSSGKGSGGLSGSSGGSKTKSAPKSARQEREEALAGQIVRQLSSANKKIQAKGAKALSENQGILSPTVRKKYGLPAASKKDNSLLGKAKGVLATGLRETGIGTALDYLDRPAQFVKGVLADTHKDEGKNSFAALKGDLQGGWAGLTGKKKYTAAEALEQEKLNPVVGFVADVGLDPTTYLSLGTTSVAKGSLKAVAKAGEEVALKKAGVDVLEKVAKDTFRTASEKAALSEAKQAAKDAGRALAADVRKHGITAANRDVVRSTLTEAARNRAAKQAEKSGLESVTLGRGGIEKTVERQMKVLSKGAKGGVGVFGKKTGLLASEKIPGVDSSIKNALGHSVTNALTKTDTGEQMVSALRRVADSIRPRAGIKRELGDAIADDIGQVFARGRAVSGVEVRDALHNLTGAMKKAKVSSDDIATVARHIEQGTVAELDSRLGRIARTVQEVIAKADSNVPASEGLFKTAVAGAEQVRQMPTVFTERAKKYLTDVGYSEAQARRIMEEGATVAEAVPEGAQQLFPTAGVTNAAPVGLADRETQLRSLLADKGLTNVSKKPLVEQNPAIIAAEAARVGGERKAVSQVLTELADVTTPDGAAILSKEARPGLVEMTISIDNVPQKVFVEPTLKPEIDALSRYLSDDRAVRATVRAYDQVNNMFKGLATVPVFAPLIQGAHFLGLGFHMRNAQGNILTNSLKGVTPVDYTRAMSLQLRNATGKLSSLSEDGRLLQAARREGVIGVDAGLADLVGRTEKSTLRGLTPQTKLGRTLNLGKKAVSPGASGASIGTGRVLGTMIEDNAKLAHFVHMVNKGLSPHDAAISVKKTLFDYEDLTEFERRVMKRIVPFYTYTRKNTPLQIAAIAQHPGLASAQGKAEGAITRDPTEDEAIPQYALQAGERPLIDSVKSFFGGNGADPMTFRWDTPLNAAKDALLPYVEIASLIPGAPGHGKVDAQNAFRDLINVPGGGPIGAAKAMIEIATGKDLFTGGDVKLDDGAIMHIYKALFPTNEKVGRAEQDSLAKKLLGLRGRQIDDKQQLNEITRRIEVLRELNKAAGVPTLEEQRKAGKAPKLTKEGGSRSSGGGISGSSSRKGGISGQ